MNNSSKSNKKTVNIKNSFSKTQHCFHMQKINWIILASKDRGIEYGVGTFIKQLSLGLASISNINVFKLVIGITKGQSVSINRIDNITFFEIPVKENDTGIDTKVNQEKVSKNIARIISQYISPSYMTIIHMNYIFQYFIAIALKKVLKGKIIFTQHVFVYENILQENYFDTEVETYKAVDKIVTVTKHGKKHLEDKGIDSNKIEVIYNGISPDILKPKINNKILKKYGLKHNEKIILYSGRIDPIKGLDYMCLAMEKLLTQLPDCRLVIAGNGNYESLINSSKKFAANISFLGFLPFEDIVALYHKATIGVIPSLEEQCSYVALEMLHCGLPVVASNLGGLKEIFVHGENALLANIVSDRTNMYGVAPKTNDLDQYMHQLLSNQDLREKYSVHAIQRANSLFTAEIMINNYLKTIKDLY